MLEIRKQENSTIEAIRKVFEPVGGEDHCALAQVFLRGTPQSVEGKELRANRIRNSNLHYEIAFLRNHLCQKTAAERMLDEHEMLPM